MDFIVLEICSSSCMRFLDLYVINVDNLFELHSYIKENFDTEHEFMIFNIDGIFIEYF